MLKKTRAIIPIDKAKNYQIKVEINSVDVTSLVKNSEFIVPLIKLGLGSCMIQLNNAGGQYSNTFEKGQTIKFYADRTNASTLKFWGRIDKVSDPLSKDGQYLVITGRHRSYFAGERQINYTANKDQSLILKDIINLFVPELTYVNVALSGVTKEVVWDYVYFTDCFNELCENAGFDGYIDNDLDVHFFEADTTATKNDDEAIVEGQNYISTDEWGTDDYFEKTRQTVIGQDDSGIPIIYTAIVSGEATIREAPVIKNSSLNTIDAVQALADAKLSEYTSRPPQSRITSYLLEPILPGDNIVILIPRIKVFGYYKLLQISYNFGSEIKFPKTTVVTEIEISDINTILKQRLVTENRIQVIDNVNKLNFSYNFDFNTSDNSGTLSDVVIQDGVLKLSGSASTGYMESDAKTATSTITEVEFRVNGSELGVTTFQISCNNGISWFSVVKNIKYDVTAGNQGTQLKIKLILLNNTENPNPIIESLAVLYT